MIESISADLSTAIASARAGLREKAIRAQYGETLLALAKENPDFLVLTADLMFATGIEKFGEHYPSRLINLGIAEQNMAGVAAGLALCGKLPIISGYAAFTTLRAVEQAKLDVAYNNVKVIMCGQSAGLSYGVGGPTHQTYEDVAIMRAIPNMTVLVPSDAQQVDACLRAALASNSSSPIYVRLGRGPEFVHSAASAPFQIGHAAQLREGRDIAILAMGSMVVEAVLAADALKSRGISARVVDIHTIKPIDAGAVRNAATGVEAVITIEEHSIHGGLGSAVLECLAEGPSTRVRLLGIGDIFPPIGPPHALRASLGLCADNVVANALDLLGQAATPHRASVGQ